MSTAIGRNAGGLTAVLDAAHDAGVPMPRTVHVDADETSLYLSSLADAEKWATFLGQRATFLGHPYVEHIGVHVINAEINGLSIRVVFVEASA